METLNKSILIYNDCSYNHAVNYQHMYNAPITLNFGEKHNRTKYIISAGTSDNITLLQDGVFIYVLAENSGSNYISLQVINTEIKVIENDIFLSDNDIDLEDSPSFGILNMHTDTQIKTLLQYC